MQVNKKGSHKRGASKPPLCRLLAFSVRGSVGLPAAEMTLQFNRSFIVRKGKLWDTGEQLIALFRGEKTHTHIRNSVM